MSRIVLMPALAALAVALSCGGEALGAGTGTATGTSTGTGLGSFPALSPTPPRSLSARAHRPRPRPGRHQARGRRAIGPRTLPMTGISVPIELALAAAMLVGGSALRRPSRR